jgi:DNA polymerase I
LYGQQAKGFCAYAKTVYGVELSLSEAVDFRGHFFATYTGVATWHQKAHQGAGTLTEGRTLMGRRILPDPNEKDEQRRWNRFQMAINFVIQGSCADALKLAMNRLMAVLPSSAKLVLNGPRRAGARVRCRRREDCRRPDRTGDERSVQRSFR